jgi:Uma2 family endonuclease
MTPAIAPLPFKATASLRKWTVDEYDQLIDDGVLTEDDRVELLEGYVVLKMPANPPHDASVTAVYRRLDRLVPPDWIVRCQVGARLAESRPEPDVSVVRGPEREYFTRHPEPADLGLVVEVADSSLDRDQLDKSRIYARDRIPAYWIVNLVDRRVEIYTDPTGPCDEPEYRTTRLFPAGSAAPVELDGTTVGTIAVDEILP